MDELSWELNGVRSKSFDYIRVIVIVIIIAIIDCFDKSGLIWSE
jgi:hypothetical protein